MRQAEDERLLGGTLTLVVPQRGDHASVDRLWDERTDEGCGLLHAPMLF